MNSRSLLKWTSLTGICIVVIFVVYGVLLSDSIHAAIDQTRKQTSGSLRVLDQTGKPIGECPLKHTEVKARVSGFISRVTVTQNFENPFPDKIEAVYTFPLPEAAAVDDMTMLIGDRIIKGKIMRRAEAQAAYAAAKQTGRIASLLDQEEPNVFTQQVANILPGEQIRITISYVETLKYEKGSYEWIFPMVLAPRYTPGGDTSGEDRLSSSTPNSRPAKTRLGHDVSLEIDLDAGVPIVEVNSATHETELQELDEKHAVVRLKDRATIPNKDFVLNYRVAGDTINDAVLAHRSDRGGFFTLILQPPLRVSAEDVMPKEIVFVLDTSGSMSGFPLDTAKRTMKLALDTLYPHDMFNLITFAGDTEILFPAPVPATPENLQKARSFLASREGNGGTEMMKAIKAALDPSDSQRHLRLACFLTDGQVGNEAEILAEIQKHPRARVFAMGFGEAPNRSLLDKMSEYGRGEVNYVLETGSSSAAARSFNDRIRNPLLTELSIDWSDLPVTDVYPKHLPDLFSVKPLMVSGRYSKGAKGTIRLQGKMAGQDFVREIPVELPELEEDHDVLATLWARRRIEELTSEEIASTQDQVLQNQKREEIAELGLTYKVMTKYTSFVAIDDVIFTGVEEPRQVEVPVIQALPGSLPSGLAEVVTVLANTSTLDASNFVQMSVVPTGTFMTLPIQARSFYTFVNLVDGVTADPRQQSNLVLDGVNLNFGIRQGGENPGPSASGNTPALTATGGGNGIVSLAATEQITVHTLPVNAEYDRVGDAQVVVNTKSGTNEFHGSAFHFSGNDALDANDWFANARGLRKPPKRLNLFGGTLGGPLKRDRTFFFASYEGMRLRQPVVGITDVPSISSRAIAPVAMRPFLDVFPVPTGASRPDGFAEFATTFANPAAHDVASLRLDHMINSKVALNGRYNFADSGAGERGANGTSLNTTNRIRSRAQTVMGSITQTLSPEVVLDLRANYSRLRVDGSYSLDQFGGAGMPPPLSPASFVFDLNSRNSSWMIGDKASSIQRQVNLFGTIAIVSGKHSFKFGGDFRRLSPAIGLRPSEEDVFFDGVGQAINGVAARANQLNFSSPQTPVFKALSLFGQDEWRQSSRLTLTYGMRWELAPPPSSENPLAVDQVNDPTTLRPLAPGSSLWKTTFANFAPRGGFAYKLSDAYNWELVLRGGVGILYDLGQDRSGEVFANSIPFISGSAVFNSPFNEDFALQFQADAFNLFNHANFEDPAGNDLVIGNKLAFGESTSLSGRSLSSGGFRSFYGFGGARTMRFSVKVLF